MSKGDDDDITTVMDVIRPYGVDMSEILSNYPFLDLVRRMLGDTPVFLKFSTLFEPIATAQFMLMGIVFNETVSPDYTTMVMHAASAIAQCSYCEMHCCTLLKSNEVQLNRITSNISDSTADAAVRRLGTSLGTLPTSLTVPIITSLREHFSEAEVECLALSGSAMGYLTSGNDLLSSDLESVLVKTSKEYLDATGWTSKNPLTKDDVPESTSGWFNGIRKLILGLQWNMLRTFAVWDIPSSAPQIHDYITNLFGASLSIFNDIQILSTRVTLAFVLREYLTSPKCTFRRSLKYAVGMAYATRANNEKLLDEMSTLFYLEQEKCDDSKCPADLGQRLCDALAEADACTTNGEWINAVASSLRTDDSLSEREVLGLIASLSMCYTPSRTCPELAHLLHNGISDMTPGGLMEMLCWTSTLVMLNRMMAFYSVRKTISE